MKLTLFSNLTEDDKASAIERLITHSTPDQDYFLMLILSVLTIIFGIVFESVPVIIGGMLIAPLLSPILSLSLGFIMSDFSLINFSFRTIVKSLLLGAFTATVIALILKGRLPAELIINTEPSLLYACVAFVAGLAASFALAKPKLNETLPGVAIAVALIPPVTLIGIGIAELNWILTVNGLFIFLLNTAGIVFAGMITFSLMNFYTKKAVVETVVTQEAERVEEEEKGGESMHLDLKSEEGKIKQSDS